MKTKLPKRVNGWVDRHGRPRYYLRIPGQKMVALPGLPWSPEFMAAYEAALAGRPAPMTARPVGAARILSVNTQKRWMVGRCVYFIRYGKRVKIGTSSNVSRRLRELNVSLPGKATIYYVTPGDQILEGELHRLFGESYVSGEWFNWSDPIRRWIAADAERLERDWLQIGGTVTNNGQFNNDIKAKN